jgi:beta-glucanase (GH16 family)
VSGMKAQRARVLLLAAVFLLPAARGAHASSGAAIAVPVADHAKSAKRAASRKEAGKEAGKEPDARANGPYGQNDADYRLTFSEEFDRLDKSLWNDHVWYEEPNPTINYKVEHGMLKIWPQRDDSGKFFNRTLDTDKRFYQQYGYFEMEAKLPRGKGTWPAFWLFAHPGERRPEIDIMEAYAGGIEPWGFTDADGVARPNAYAATIWSDKEQKAGEHVYVSHSDLSTRFHKYALKWEPDRITFYFDGKQMYSTRAYLSDPMYIMVDLWFGSASGEPDESTPEGKANSFEIKYVRAWQFR